MSETRRTDNTEKEVKQILQMLHSMSKDRRSMVMAYMSGMEDQKTLMEMQKAS